MITPPLIIVRHAGKEERAAIERALSEALRVKEDGEGRQQARRRWPRWMKRWNLVKR